MIDTEKPDILENTFIFNHVLAAWTNCLVLFNFLTKIIYPGEILGPFQGNMGTTQTLLKNVSQKKMSNSQ